MADDYDMTDGIDLVSVELGNRTFTFNSVEYPCAAGEVEASKTLADGGFMPESTLEIVAKVSDLPDPAPGEQDVITYLGNGYRIVSVRTSPDETFLVFGCVDDSRGA